MTHHQASRDHQAGTEPREIRSSDGRAAARAAIERLDRSAVEDLVQYAESLARAGGREYATEPEDLVQDAISGLLTGDVRVRAPLDRPDRFLRRVIRGIWLNRARGRLPIQGPHPGGGYGGRSVSFHRVEARAMPAQEDVEDRLVRGLHARSVEARISGLPRSTRRVARLLLEGRTSSEVSRLLGISTSAVRRQRRAAAQALQGWLDVDPG